MSHPDTEAPPASSARSWFWLMANLAFSSLILLFLFWTSTVFLILDNMRLETASAAHILLIFDTPPSPKEIQGLTATMEKIAGTGSLSALQAPDQKSRTGRATSRRILSVAVSLGQTPDGHFVTLSEQISSIRQILKNDSEIKEIVFNPDWVSRVDALAGISLGVRKGIVVLGGLLLVGLALYWGRISLPFWAHLFPGSRSREARAQAATRSAIFQRQEDLPPPPSAPFEKKGDSPPVILRLPSGALWGMLASSIAIFLVWLFRTILYPGLQNPFMVGAMGANPIASHLWILFPVFCGAIGLLGGLVCLILPLSSKSPDVLRP